jgi:hypothetical protein|tara:strand:- start:1006 stop:1254 length:249 start_codon:yes stop_codon:yes gene_type:complete
MENKAKRPMSKSTAKPGAKKPMTKSSSNDMTSKLNALRKENRELKAQLKGGPAKKGASSSSDSGKKESMKEKMERLRSMRKK